MFKQNHAQLLADMLRQRRLFRRPSISSIHVGTDYRLYSNVSVHCITGKKRTQTTADLSVPPIDLLICRGKEAIYAVIFDGEDFKSNLHQQLDGLPLCFLTSEEMNEEFAGEICGEIAFDLHCDMDTPEHTGWYLHALSLRMAAVRMKAPAILDKLSTHATAYLQSKHLVDSAGMVTPYGRSCGLFHFHSGQRTGHSYVVASRYVDALHQALQWFDAKADNASLECRLKRIQEGLPVESARKQSHTLQQLLDMPLEDYFQYYPQDLQHLHILLNRGQFLSFSSEVSAFGDREDIRTYGDVLYAVRNLWEHTAHRDYGNDEVTGVCRDILLFLSFPLWSKPEISATNSADLPAEDLQHRLYRIRPEIYRTPLSLMPLTHYFYGTACMTESDFPLWLYQKIVKPLLAFYRVEDPLCVQALSEVYNLSQADDESKNEDAFHLLYDILVEPFAGIL